MSKKPSARPGSDKYAPPAIPKEKRKAKKEKKEKKIKSNLTMSADEWREYQSKRNQRRKDAQKRLEREQLMTIRRREKEKLALGNLGDEERKATERWQEKMRKQQKKLLDMEEQGDEGVGQALHPATQGVKLRHPKAYTV
jgi:hypothetical protein